MKNLIQITFLSVLFLMGHLVTGQSFNFISTDGSSSGFSLNEIENIVFTNNNFKVYKTSGDEVTYSIFNLQKMIFDEASAIPTSHFSKEGTDNNLSVYPNPTNNLLTVKANTTAADAYIINYMGNVVQTVVINQGQTTIDVSTLAPGLYFLKNSDARVKFIKQ